MKHTTIRANYTPAEIEDLADQLCELADWRKIAGKVIAKGKRTISHDERMKRKNAMIAINKARRAKQAELSA